MEAGEFAVELSCHRCIGKVSDGRSVPAREREESECLRVEREERNMGEEDKVY